MGSSRILDPDDEQFFPGQPRQLYDLLPGEKRIIEFTQERGANFHCQPTGRQLTHTQVLDWLSTCPSGRQRTSPRPDQPRWFPGMKSLTLVLAFLPLIVFSVLARFLPHGYIGVAGLVAAVVALIAHPDQPPDLAAEDPQQLLAGAVHRDRHPRLHPGER